MNGNSGACCSRYYLTRVSCTGSDQSETRANFATFNCGQQINEGWPHLTMTESFGMYGCWAGRRSDSDFSSACQLLVDS
jgi:hypothetical protein